MSTLIPTNPGMIGLTPADEDKSERLRDKLDHLLAEILALGKRLDNIEATNDLILGALAKEEKIQSEETPAEEEAAESSEQTGIRPTARFIESLGWNHATLRAGIVRAAVSIAAGRHRNGLSDEDFERILAQEEGFTHSLETVERLWNRSRGGLPKSAIIAVHHIAKKVANREIADRFVEILLIGDETADFETAACQCRERYGLHPSDQLALNKAERSRAPQIIAHAWNQFFLGVSMQDEIPEEVTIGRFRLADLGLS